MCHRADHVCVTLEFGQTDDVSEGFPTGTVTFLMTDVEDSTPSWEAHRDVMGPVMARHVKLVAHAVARHGGKRPVEQGEGDSVVAVFAMPSAAVLAALEAQRALSSERWPAGVSVAVRMAVHTGET